MKKLILTIFIFISCTGIVLGDEDHYINIFVGDRAAGLGGAYTAIADGPEGAFYNPAGLAYSSSKYFSLSANAIQYKQLTYRNIWKNAPDPIDYNRYSFSFIPNFFGFLQKQKHFTFAITICAPDSEFYDQRDRIDLPISTGTETLKFTTNINLNLIDMVYEVGPSFAFLPHKMVAIGFGAFLTYRDYKLIYSQAKQLEKYNYFSISSEYFSERSIGMKFQFGVQIMPTDFMAIGYNISLPLGLVWIINKQVTNHDNYDAAFATDFGFPAYNFKANTYIVDNQLTVENFFVKPLFRPTALKQALGIAFFVSKSLIVSTDFYLYVTLQRMDEVATMNLINWNLSAGIEWYITQNFPLRLGFFTNNSNTKMITTDTNGMSTQMNSKDHVDLYGGSITIGYSTSDLAINLGGSFSYGRGKAQIIADTNETQDMDLFAFNLFISGGYQF